MQKKRSSKNMPHENSHRELIHDNSVLKMERERINKR